MSTLTFDEPAVVTVLRPDLHQRANLAICTVLDAEISTLQARMAQRSANMLTVCGVLREDLARQVAWLQESLTRLQNRRDALC